MTSFDECLPIRLLVTTLVSDTKHHLSQLDEEYFLESTSGQFRLRNLHCGFGLRLIVLAG